MYWLDGRVAGRKNVDGLDSRTDLATAMLAWQALSTEPSAWAGQLQEAGVGAT